MDLPQYATHCFSLATMRKYKEYSENGRPEVAREELDKTVSGSKYSGRSLNNTGLPENKSFGLFGTSTIDSYRVMYNGSNEMFLRYFIQEHNS